MPVTSFDNWLRSCDDRKSRFTLISVRQNRKMKTIQIILVIIFTILTIEAEAIEQDYRQIIDLRGYWKFNIGDNSLWANPDFDDSDWDDIYVPAAWEDEGFNGYDGYAWYRVNFDLRKDESDAYYLELGYVDDADEVYINGTLIGFTGGFPPDFYTAHQSFRRYYIPTEILEEGLNTLAVRVYDTVLDGGILKGRVGIYIQENMPRDTYILEGIWKFRDQIRDDYRSEDYDDSRWVSTNVPGYWQSMKWMHNRFNSYRIENQATYRKEFHLPSNLQDKKNLVIVLGKIDDFDEVFLNGVKIGETNDGRPFGRSESYTTYRVYGLYESGLNRYGKNTIVVEVKDLGGDAGIYEGPIAITTTENYQRLIRSYRD